MIKQLLFKIAKKPFMGRLVGEAFRRCAWAIPVKKVYADGDVIAFYHPRPCYENHIILSPKRAVQTLQKMAEDGHSRYFARIWAAAGAIRAARPEYGGSFALLANGGPRQEVQQVHFHLFTGREIVSARGSAGEAVYGDEVIRVSRPAEADWEIQFVIEPASPAAGSEAYFEGVLRGVNWLDARFDLARRGYSLVYQGGAAKDDGDCPVFHVTAGRRLKKLADS